VIFYVPREEIKYTWNGHALIITSKGPAENLAAQPQRVGDAVVVSNIPEKASSAPAAQQVRSPRPLIITASAAIVTIASVVILFFLVRVRPDDAAAIHAVARESANNSAQSQTEPGRFVTDGATANASESTTNKAAPITAVPAPAAEHSNPAPDTLRPLIASKSETDPSAARPEPSTPPLAHTLPQATAETVSSAPAEPSSAADLNRVAPSPTVLPAASGPSATASSGETRFDGDHITATTAAAPAHGSSAAELAALLARGDALFSRGDLLAARLLYEHAADAGDGQAALKLGETFDPVFLDRAHLHGARGDWSMAMSWYRRARDLGVPEAEMMLKSLETK
jgi:TPR repeat protein